MTAQQFAEHYLKREMEPFDAFLSQTKKSYQRLAEWREDYFKWSYTNNPLDFREKLSFDEREKAHKIIPTTPKSGLKGGKFKFMTKDEYRNHFYTHFKNKIDRFLIDAAQFPDQPPDYWEESLLNHEYYTDYPQNIPK